jgi:hypothetical protein
MSHRTACQKWVVILFILAAAQLNWATTSHFLTAKNLLAGSTPVEVKVADVNGDGKLDMVVVDGGNQVTILLGNGNGTFQAPKHSPAGSQPTTVAIADLNHDGKLDLVVANGTNHISVLLGNGNGTFKSPVSYAVGNAPVSVAIAG